MQGRQWAGASGRILALSPSSGLQLWAMEGVPKDITIPIKDRAYERKAYDSAARQSRFKS